MVNDLFFILFYLVAFLGYNYPLFLLLNIQSIGLFSYDGNFELYMHKKRESDKKDIKNRSA